MRRPIASAIKQALAPHACPTLQCSSHHSLFLQSPCSATLFLPHASDGGMNPDDVMGSRAATSPSRDLVPQDCGGEATGC